ncbi:MAG: hypothetical protein JRN26_05955 [Nitrososphaerota archaeon]|jgi:DNA-binding IscR family transcriptional regulator|nr:hypothetical protein [Nitrososphaerota archaeon]MDG6926991.1 hypothetical protein [Nitrososphaerota archaeon]MDG6930448.1 hypothetical protein [Nitrososphaerota archaeon]MDG6931489.1 hypothetical protein [Nitrososphaerota archaeon]MDG6936406.1 hypothetical protein [Nitrososphaerota archaeon]
MEKSLTLVEQNTDSISFDEMVFLLIIAGKKRIVKKKEIIAKTNWDRSHYKQVILKLQKKKLIKINGKMIYFTNDLAGVVF